jgi:hypothetical protein
MRRHCEKEHGSEDHENPGAMRTVREKVRQQPYEKLSTGNIVSGMQEQDELSNKSDIHHDEFIDDKDDVVIEENTQESQLNNDVAMTGEDEPSGDPSFFNHLTFNPTNLENTPLFKSETSIRNNIVMRMYKFYVVPFFILKIMIADEEIDNFGLQNGHLDGKKTYLATNEFLRSIGCHLHRHYRFIGCVACQKAVVPSHLYGHIKTHDIPVPCRKTEFMKKLKEVVDEFQIVENESIISPNPKGPPVEGLRVHEGLACTQCTSILLQKSSLDNHYSSKHRDVGIPQGQRWRPCMAQTFFHPKWVRYFEVEPSLQGVAPCDVFTAYSQQVLPHLPEIDVNTAQNNREIQPLLNVMKWHEHLGDYHTDPSLRRKLLMLVSPVEKGSDEENVNILVLKYMKDVAKEASNAPFVVLRIIQDFPV